MAVIKIPFLILSLCLADAFCAKILDKKKTSEFIK